jgi:hypothetical protein
MAAQEELLGSENPDLIATLEKYVVLLAPPIVPPPPPN